VDRGYLQAPFRSGISIEDFQLDPLARAIDMARTNLLIADDVGLPPNSRAGVPSPAISRHACKCSNHMIGCAVGENSTDLVGSVRVRRHPHHRA